MRKGKGGGSLHGEIMEEGTRCLDQVSSQREEQVTFSEGKQDRGR